MAEQLLFDLPMRAAFEREAFLVADSNAEAVALIDTVADWEPPVQWIYGPAGSGKTHLTAVLIGQYDPLCLSARHLAQASDLQALLHGDVGHRMVVLQDLDDLTQGDEESLFHVLNHIRQSGQKMLLVSRAPAARLDIALPDLASRLKAVPAVAMGAPDAVLLGGLLGKLFADRQIRVSDKVIGYMVPRMERDFAAMGDLVNAIDQRALERQKPVTVPLVAEVMSNLTVAS